MKIGINMIRALSILINEYNKLKLLKDYRNKLSHLSVLSMVEIQRLRDK